MKCPAPPVGAGERLMPPGTVRVLGSRADAACGHHRCLWVKCHGDAARVSTRTAYVVFAPPRTVVLKGEDSYSLAPGDAVPMASAQPKNSRSHLTDPQARDSATRLGINV